ncbi:nucleotidyltransferase family protein [Salinicoccus halodurans]|nr:nucleotidyltransferase family protein [Salinicoccus halodurans]
MGEPKLALPIGEETMLEKIVRNACASKARSVTVILNKKFYFLLEDIEHLSVNIVWNENYREGMSSSLKIGLESIQNYAEDIMILLADQPDITTEIMNNLITHHFENNYFITQPLYCNGVGHPVIFNKKLFKDILKIEGDKGGREILVENKNNRQLIEFNITQPIDIDTKNEYLEYLNKEVI